MRPTQEMLLERQMLKQGTAAPSYSCVAATHLDGGRQALYTNKLQNPIPVLLLQVFNFLVTEYVPVNQELQALKH